MSLTQTCASYQCDSDLLLGDQLSQRESIESGNSSASQLCDVCYVLCAMCCATQVQASYVMCGKVVNFITGRREGRFK